MKKLKSLKDGTKFKISKRKSGATYKVIKKAHGKVCYTSQASEKSWWGKGEKNVYPV